LSRVWITLCTDTPPRGHKAIRLAPLAWLDLSNGSAAQGLGTPAILASRRRWPGARSWVQWLVAARLDRITRRAHTLS
jgi:hypothetical protein